MPPHRGKPPEGRHGHGAQGHAVLPHHAGVIVKCATGSTNIYKQHIMHALMDAGYAEAIYGELYDKLFAPGTGAASSRRNIPIPGRCWS